MAPWLESRERDARLNATALSTPRAFGPVSIGGRMQENLPHQKAGGEMSPEQIEALGRSIVAATRNNGEWWGYLLMFIFAAGGAWMGAYLRKKAEYMAAREEFQLLKRQLVENTQAVEEVKSALAGQGWVRQQHWAHREKHYMELLKHLAVFRNTNAILREYHLTGWFKTSDEEARDKYIEGVSAERSAALVELRELSGPAAVFLSDAAISALNSMFGQKDAIANNAADPYDYYDMWGVTVQTAFDQVMNEAKRALEAAELTY